LAPPSGLPLSHGRKLSRVLRQALRQKGRNSQVPLQDRCIEAHARRGRVDGSSERQAAPPVESGAGRWTLRSPCTGTTRVRVGAGGVAEQGAAARAGICVPKRPAQHRRWAPVKSIEPASAPRDRSSDNDGRCSLAVDRRCDTSIHAMCSGSSRSKRTECRGRC